MTVSKVDSNLVCIEENCQEVWKLYLQSKLVNDKNMLVDECVETLATLFQSSSVVPLENICQATEGNKLSKFFIGLFGSEVIDLKQMSKVAANSCQSLALVKYAS